MPQKFSNKLREVFSEYGLEITKDFQLLDTGVDDSLFKAAYFVALNLRRVYEIEETGHFLNETAYASWMRGNTAKRMFLNSAVRVYRDEFLPLYRSRNKTRRFHCNV